MAEGTWSPPPREPARAAGVGRARGGGPAQNAGGEGGPQGGGEGMGMRRGGRARRAMLGAVAAGALLGAAQGFNLGWKSLLAPVSSQTDGEAGGYAGRAVSVSSWGNRLAVREAKADESKSQVSAEMSPVHRRRLAEDGSEDYTITLESEDRYKVVTPAGEIGIDATTTVGVYDILPPSTGATLSAGGVALETTCEAGTITLDASNGRIACVVGTPDGEATDGDDIDVEGPITVTATGGEVTTIAGDSNRITVTGGTALDSQGTNYKIELNTENGAFTETVTVDDGAGTVTVTETTTVDGVVVAGPDTTTTVTVDDGAGTVTVTKTMPDGTVTETAGPDTTTTVASPPPPPTASPPPPDSGNVSSPPPPPTASPPPPDSGNVASPPPPDSGNVTVITDNDGTKIETERVIEANGTVIDTAIVTETDGTVTETETVTDPVIPATDTAGAIQIVTVTKTVTDEFTGEESVTKSEETTETIEENVNAVVINERLETLADLRAPLPPDGLLLDEQGNVVQGIKIEVVTKKNEGDDGSLKTEKVIFIANLTTTEFRSAARKLQQTSITTKTDYQSEIDVSTGETFENLKVKVTDGNEITDTTTEDGVTIVIKTENDVVVSCTPRTAPTCEALVGGGDVPGGDDGTPGGGGGTPGGGGGGGGGSPAPVPDVPVPDPDVPGGGGETPAPPAPPAVSCAVSGRKKKRQCKQKPAGKCIFQKKGKRCLPLPANGGLCTAFTRKRLCRRAGSPCVWTGGRKRGSCGPAQ